MRPNNNDKKIRRSMDIQFVHKKEFQQSIKVTVWFAIASATQYQPEPKKEPYMIPKKI